LQSFDGIVEGHDGEIFSLAFVPDGTLIASAGWDGFLRLWDPATATPLVKLRASAKPLSACAVSPDGKQYLTGSMEGILAVWDAATQQPVQSSLIHTRPIAAIRFSADGRLLATAGWDRQVNLRRLDKVNDVKTLSGHQDILAGCAFLPGGQELLSWGADGSLRLWDTPQGGEITSWQAHDDRVTSAALSPDGTQALTGSRDGRVKLWELGERRELVSIALGNEVRGLFFLLDAQAAVAVDADGAVVLLSLPGFEVVSEIAVGHKVMCADLSPSGALLAVGGEDGYLYQVAIQGDNVGPLFVTPTRTQKVTTSLLGRLFGRAASLTEAFAITCPRCRASSEMRTLPEKPIRCRHCGQAIRINAKAVAAALS
jgi:WD40 repeat protein